MPPQGLRIPPMRRVLIYVMLFGAGLCGCQARTRFVTPQRLHRGLVVVLPGIEGVGVLNAATCRGLNDGGVNWAIERFDWTTGVPGNYLYHLRAEARNRKQAVDLAKYIVAYQDSHPGRPVVLIGQSGGAAIAAWAAEALPAGRRLTGIIMLAPALSPRYMLQQSLFRSERGIVSFYSLQDWVFLGMGTMVYGTMDGEHSSSAGRTGFDIPDAGGTPKVYERLFQIAWHHAMSGAGHRGGHLSSGAGRFVAAYVAPLVLARRWDERVIARVLNKERLDHPVLPPAGQWRPGPAPVRRPSSRPAADTSQP